MVWSLLGRGAYGLTLFFMISGFVILMTLERTRRPRDFVVARASRLLPAFWVAVLFTFGLTHLFGLPGRTVSAVSALLNLTMGAEWLGVPYVDGVYWTLSLELAFYGFMWLLFVTKGLQNVEQTVAVWLALHLAVLLTFPHLPRGLELALLIGRAQFFAAGMLFYRISRDGMSGARIALLLACVGTLWAAGAAKADVAVFSAFCGVFTLLVSQRLGWIVSRPLVYLGAISYSLYLVHQNLGYVVLRGAYDWTTSTPTAIGVAVIAAVGVASALHLLVEKPAMEYLRSRFPRKAPPEPLAPEAAPV